MEGSATVPAIVSGIPLLVVPVFAFRHRGAGRVVPLLLAGPLYTYTVGLIRNADAPTTERQLRWAALDMGGDPQTVAIPLAVVPGALVVWLARLPGRRRQRREAARLRRDGTMRPDIPR